MRMLADPSLQEAQCAALRELLPRFGVYEDRELVPPSRVAARALLSLDHFALLKRKLGLWGVDDDSTNDVAAYHAAVARFERTPPPSPVQAVVEGLRHGHVRALRGASARAVVDGARARSVVAQDWRQYEDVVRVHVTELTQALKQANARKRRESLQKKDMSEVGELDLDPARCGVSCQEPLAARHLPALLRRATAWRSMLLSRRLHWWLPGMPAPAAVLPAAALSAAAFSFAAFSALREDFCRRAGKHSGCVAVLRRHSALTILVARHSLLPTHHALRAAHYAGSRYSLLATHYSPLATRYVHLLPAEARRERMSIACPSTTSGAASTSTRCRPTIASSSTPHAALHRRDDAQEAVRRRVLGVGTRRAHPGEAAGPSMRMLTA